MADTPKGLLTEEQQNLLVQVINTDAQPIPVTGAYLERLASVVSSNVSVTAKPRANDIIGVASNLSAVVPTGFLLLHNDLEELRNKLGGTENKGEENNTFASVVALLKPMLIGAGAAVVAAGIVKGLFGGVSGKTTNHLQEVVDDLNSRLTADDLASDSTVLAAQKVGFIAYMEAYFLQQAASLMISGTLEAVGEGAGKAVVGFFKNLFGMQEEEDEVSKKLKDIVETIIMAQTANNYMEDSAVKTAVKVGIIAYMTTYFLTQAAVMATDTLATGIAGAAGGAVNSFFSNLFGLGGPKSYDKIQSIVDEIINAQVAGPLAEDEKVKNAVRTGLSFYISMYFKTQALSMSAETLATGVAGAVGGAVNSFFSNLFGQGGPKSYEKIQSIIDEIIDAQEAGSLIEDEAVKSAVREGLGYYISMYFKTQALSMSAETLGNSLGTSVAGAITSFFGTLFGKTQESANGTDKIKEIADTLIEDIDTQEAIGWEEVQAAKREGVKSYIQTYFTVMAEQALRPEAKQSVAEKALNVVGGFLNSLFGRTDQAEEAQTEGIAKLIRAMLSDINVDTLLKDAEIMQAKKDGIKSYVTSYFAAMSDVLIEKSKSDVVKGYEKYAAKDGWFSENKTRAGGKTPQEFFAEIAAITFSLSNQDMPSSAELSAIKKQSILDTAKAILNAEITSFSKDIDFSKNKISYNIQSETSINTAVEEPNSASMLQTLNDISSMLSKLSTIIEAIRDNGSGVTMINTPSESSIDTNINIPG